MKFKVVLDRSDEGVAVCAPSLPGCWSQGETEDEALANIAEAIREYLDTPIEGWIDPEVGAEVREIEVAASRDEMLRGYRPQDSRFEIPD